MAATSPTNTLRVITFNVWFDPFAFPQRFDGLLDELRASNADIIGLQEVTAHFEERLLAATPGSWLANYVYCARVAGGAYGTAALARASLAPTFARHALPSEMERDLLLARVGPLVVGVVHLESLNNEDVREAQLRACAGILASESSALLVGDFNFCSQWSYRDMQRSRDAAIAAPAAFSPPPSAAPSALSPPPSAAPSALRGAALRALGSTPQAPAEPAAPRPLENTLLATVLPDFVDAWPAAHPGEVGFTFDSLRNFMLTEFEQMRYDRILFKLPRVRLDGVELLGTRELPCAAGASAPTSGFATPPRRGRPVFMSDHFGLVATFTML